VVWQEGAKDVVIEDNVFYDNARETSAGTARAIDFHRSGAGNVVRNNTFCGAGPAIADTRGGASYAESGSRDAGPACPVKP
jgi:hypothetical protein